MDLPPRNVLSLCTGIDGIALGLEIAFPEARVVCHVEIEAFAVAVLQARMEEGSVVPSPVFTDLRSFDGRPWRGTVDCIAGGFPCQSVSIAGARRAQADERWLWEDFARIISEVSPRWVMLENVRGLLSAGHGTAHRDVLRSLACLGFDAEWCVIPASGVGASHKRERWFCLARRQLADDPGEHERTQDNDRRTIAQRRKPRRNPDRGGVRPDGPLGDTSGTGTGDRCCATGGRGGETADTPQPETVRPRNGATGTGRPTAASVPLGDTGGKRDQRRRKPGNVSRTAGAAGGNGEQRQRGGDAADGNGGRAIESLGDTGTEGLPECQQPESPDYGDRKKTHGPVGQSGDSWPACSQSASLDEVRLLRELSVQYPQDACTRLPVSSSGGMDDRPILDGQLVQQASRANGPGRGVGLANATTSEEPRGILPLFPPGPGRRDLWRDILHDHPGLAPALEPEETESALRDVADGLSSPLDVPQPSAGRKGEDGSMESPDEAGVLAPDWPRIDSLRSLGNACVPLQCAATAMILYQRFQES